MMDAPLKPGLMEQLMAMLGGVHHAGLKGQGGGRPCRRLGGGGRGANAKAICVRAGEAGVGVGGAGGSCGLSPGLRLSPRLPGVRRVAKAVGG